MPARGASPARTAATPNAAGAATGSPDLARAVGYLSAPANLIGGHYYEPFPGSGLADFGLTMDGAFALAADGSNPAALIKIVNFVDQRGKDATGSTVDDWTGIGTPYVNGGSLGKEALLAEVTGYDPTDFGGHNLITALAASSCPAATTGADTSCVATGNYAYASSVFAQAIGVIAQLRAGDAADAGAPISYLQSLQQAGGAWPSLLPATGDSDVDSTAIAVMALALVPGASAAVAKGIAWIAGQQLADGGFPGTAGDSTNSAALAIQALTLDQAGHASQISKALAFLAGEQNADGGFNSAADAQPGSDLRASAQAVSGAVGMSFGTLTRDIHSLAAAAAGASYLVTQLVDGDHLVNAYGPDYGLTADLAIALAADGGQDRALAKVLGYLSAHVADYADPAGTSDYPGPYGGAVGKLALLAEITGQDPHAFGGFDLLATLTGHVCAAADSTGGCSAAGDFYQAFSGASQSLAVLALARGQVQPPAAAVGRLEELQCLDGGFSSTLIVAGGTCTSEVDTTGYALQALLLVPGTGSVTAQAEAYLLAGQQGDGGYLGAAGANTNSTSLAVQALLAIQGAAALPALAGNGGRAAAVRAAATPAGAIQAGKAFVLARQNSNGGFGVSAATPASDARPTTQAVPALAGATLATLSDPVTPISPNPPTSTASSSQPASSGAGAPVTSESPVADGGQLAVTGARTAGLLWWALLLLLAGGIATGLGGRPAPGRRP
ncbi:MAG: prenyltransferase/squalene oxidase repeat-containing protein [Jatrophihabitans sp.]